MTKLWSWSPDTMFFNDKQLADNSIIISMTWYSNTYKGARRVMVIVTGNGHSDTDSNFGRGYLHFQSTNNFEKGKNSTNLRQLWAISRAKCSLYHWYSNWPRVIKILNSNLLKYSEKLTLVPYPPCADWLLNTRTHTAPIYIYIYIYIKNEHQNDYWRKEMIFKGLVEIFDGTMCISLLTKPLGKVVKSFLHSWAMECFQ